MNKLKILVASMLCSFFVIGLAGCGDETPEGSACTQATAANDCASSTATKYVCHKQGNKETCLRECVNDDNCTSAENCLDSSNPGKKVCLPKASEGGNKCGDKTCKADEVCDESGAKPTCKAKVEKKTYFSIMIVDQSEGDACTEKDAGSDIGGVIIKSHDGTPKAFFGSSSYKPNGTIGAPYNQAMSLPEAAFEPQREDKCPFIGLGENTAKAIILGCGGKATFNTATATAFQTGDKVQIFEYDGNICYKGTTPPATPSPDDKYAVYACKSNTASVEPEANIDGDNCVKLGENLSGTQTLDVP